MSALLVNEIFHSIQGESSRMGLPCVFVRLTGCNLRCVWCDTAYAFDEGKRMTVDEVRDKVRQYNCPLVELTGGEPLAQPAAFELMKDLCDEGYEVLLETGGSLDISPVDPRVLRIVDLKCPGSGMSEHNLWSNIDELRATDEVKFVVRDRADFDWAAETMTRYGIDRRCPVLLSPVFGDLEPVELARWILDEKLPVRMQLQMHKYVWEPTARGV